MKRKMSRFHRGSFENHSIGTFAKISFPAFSFKYKMQKQHTRTHNFGLVWDTPDEHTLHNNIKKFTHTHTILAWCGTHPTNTPYTIISKSSHTHTHKEAIFTSDVCFQHSVVKLQGRNCNHLTTEC